MIVWMDGIVFKVRKMVRSSTRPFIYVGLNKEGLKRVLLGMWVGKNESAAFWMGVLTDPKARGVKIY